MCGLRGEGRRLQVVLDALLYQPESAGIGQYIWSLFSAYHASYAEVDTVQAFALPHQKIPGAQMIYPGDRLEKSRQRLLFEQWRLPQLLSRMPYDVVHFPDYQVPAFRRVPRSVSTVHDLVAFKYPEFFPRSQSLVKRRLMALSVRAAARIIVPSTQTAEDLQEILHVPPEKIAVVPHGVIRHGTPQTARPNERPYFIAVGTLEPRKNFIRVIEAFASWVHQDHLRGEVDLLIAGKKGWLYQPLLDSPSRLGIAGQVRFLNYVSEDALATLYRHALALVYPSLYEGFGLPVLEAMAWGCPVICSSRGALAEVAGGASCIVDPLRVESIAQAMAQMWGRPEERVQWKQRGELRAGTYTWAKAAALTRKVYTEILQVGL